jgi:hypothetical protein
VDLVDDPLDHLLAERCAYLRAIVARVKVEVDAQEAVAAAKRPSHVLVSYLTVLVDQGGL